MNNKKNKDVAIVFDDLTEFFVMKNAIDAMKKEHLSVDIITPASSGYNGLSNHTIKTIRQYGYDVLDSVNNTEYKILLTPYPNIKDIDKVKHCYHIKYPYGPIAASKPRPVYDVHWNIQYDAIIIFNNYEKNFFEGYGIETRQVPYWRFLDFHKKDHAGKPNLFIAPTFGDVSCIDLLTEDNIIKLKNKYTIIIKSHHRIHFHPDERMRFQKIKKIADVFYDSDKPIEEILQESDVVLSDSSGAIFDAICAGVPVAIATSDINYHQLGEFKPYQSKLVDKGVIPFSNNSENIIEVIELAQSQNYKAKQKEERKNLFSFNKDPMESFIEIINEFMIKDYIKDERKKLHSFLNNAFWKKVQYIKWLEEQLENRKEEIRELESKVTILEKSEKEIKNSKSWLITKPLRYISYRIRKLLRK